MPSRRRAQRSRILDLLDQFEPALARAFRDAIAGIRSDAIMREVEAAVATGRADAVMRALRIDRAALLSLETGIAQAYTASGVSTASAITASARAAGVATVFRFDMRNVAAETWLRQHSSTRVTAIVADQREAIRVALEAGMGRGVNPRTTALDIVGRINRATQRREGGIVGLTSQQAGYVENARAELLSGDPARLRNYLTRERRDKRFDRAVMRAINDGAPVPADVVGRAAGRYSDQLLRLRGEVIGRTEALEGLHAAQHEAFRQIVETGQVRADQVVRVWSATGDNRVREDHRDMDGQSVGLNEPFVFPDGSRAMFPGDGSLGAPAEQIIQCRCWSDERIDWLAGIEREPAPADESAGAALMTKSELRDFSTTVRGQRVQFTDERARENFRPVMVDVAKLDQAWRSSGDWVGEGAEIGNRRTGFINWLRENVGTRVQTSQIGGLSQELVRDAAGSPIRLADGTFQVAQVPVFSDGRHRFSVFRDEGVTRLPISVSEDIAEQFAQLYGAR